MLLFAVATGTFFCDQKGSKNNVNEFCFGEKASQEVIIEPTNTLIPQSRRLEETKYSFKKIVDYSSEEIKPSSIMKVFPFFFFFWIG